MRQLADRTNILPGPKTPRAVEGNQTESGVRMPPWSPRICLPLLSENNRVLWVHAHEVNMQPDKVAELDKAFSRSPYLTQKQTAALAKRCSLHPDQVKVWFIAQRLRYGISWDHKDISEMWSKFNSDHDEERDEECEDEVNNDNLKGRNPKSDRRNSGGDSNMELEKPPRQKTCGNVKKNEATTPTKRRRRQLISQRKRLKANDGTYQVENPGTKVDPIKSKGQTSYARDGADLTGAKRRAWTRQISSPGKNDHENLLDKNDIPLVSISSDVLKPQNQTSQTDLLVRNMSSLEEEIKASASLEEALSDEAGKHTTGARQETHSAEEVLAATRVKVKTQSQLVILKRSFLERQYPDSEQYNVLARLVGINRRYLVEWFRDVRYAVKQSKPRWMTDRQHKEVVANIMYQQYKNNCKRGLLREGQYYGPQHM